MAAVVVVALWAIAFATAEVGGGGSGVRTYNVVWTDLLPESKSTYVNTMPIGNGNLAANVYPDSTSGTLGVLISKADAWDEAAELIKVGLVDITLDPNPFTSPLEHFNMTLDLLTATVYISVTEKIQAALWVDATTNIIVVDVDVEESIHVGTKVTLVREKPKVDQSYPFDCSKYNISADILDESKEPTIFYHHNIGTAYYTNTLQDQNLREAIGKIPNRITGRTTGAAVFTATTETKPTTMKKTIVGIAVRTTETGTVDEWKAGLLKQVAAGIPDRAAGHLKWWDEYWSRSWFRITSTTTTNLMNATLAGSVVSRQYALQRYLQGLQGRSPYPLKFNGQLFTATRAPNMDTRQWGGLNWWQNARLPSYSMLAAGDSDLLQTLFDSFLATLPLAQLRTKIYYNHTGAFWPEYTTPLLGTTHSASYGCGRAGKTSPPIGYSDDRWNHYNMQGGLDLSLMVLDHWDYTQDEAALKRYLPIAVNVCVFYGHRWKGRDSQGKWIMFPTQAVETWQCPGYPPTSSNCCTNDAPTLGGLWAVVPRLLSLPSGYLTPTEKSTLSKILSELPPLPTSGTGNATALIPCQKMPPHTSNVENAELYPVHPYRIYGVGKANLQHAVNAYHHKRFGSDVGWNQNAMDAALLGLVTDAQKYVTARAAAGPAPGYRFPAFMPHYQDYPPSLDHLSVMNAAVTYMVMQADAGKILLLPAWPCEWDVDFKVHAPEQTVVQGTVEKGKVKFTVVPASREKDVVVINCA